MYLRHYEAYPPISRSHPREHHLSLLGGGGRREGRPQPADLSPHPHGYQYDRYRRNGGNQADQGLFQKDISSGFILRGIL